MISDIAVKYNLVKKKKELRFALITNLKTF